MLTIFTVPKPFEGHIAIIQKNAIGSWTRLRPRCEVLLFGDEPGTREAAEEFGVEWIPDVTRNEFGTPLLDLVFRLAEERASHNLLCYVNSDIVLLSDFIAAVRVVRSAKPRFVMVGQRWDVDVTGRLAMDGDSWEAALRAQVQQAGTANPPMGSDHFVYPKGTFGPLPPFAVGRPGWDNWMIYRARRSRIAVLDVSAATVVVHQNHGYGHVPNRTGNRWEGPEADQNRALVGPKRRIFTLADATHRLTPDGLIRARSATDLKRRLITQTTILAPAGVQPIFRAGYFVARSARRTWIATSTRLRYRTTDLD